MIEQRFNRRIPLGAGDEAFNIDALPLGWFSISHRLVPDKSVRRSLRGRWCCLRNTSTNERIYRTLRFSATLGREYVWIDYDGWLTLSGRAERVPREMMLSIRPTHWWEVTRLGEGHPDPAYRLALRVSWVMGLLSVLLGVLSIVGTLPIAIGLAGAAFAWLVSAVTSAVARRRNVDHDETGDCQDEAEE